MCCEGVDCVLPFIFQFLYLHLDFIDFENAVCGVCWLGYASVQFATWLHFNFSDEIYFTLTLFLWFTLDEI